MIEKVVIIGSGPAGYSSAIYLARAMLNPLMITGILYGGQLMQTSDIENYPGVFSIGGQQLMSIMHDQAKQFGTRFLTKKILDAYLEPDTITMLVYSLKSGGSHVVTAYKNAHDNNIYIIDRDSYPRGIITDSGLLMSDFLRTEPDIKSIYLYFIVPRSIAVSQLIPPGSFSPKRKIKRKEEITKTSCFF